MNDLQIVPSGEQSSVSDAAATADTAPRPDSVIEADDLVEEISIDGMCGVY